jgi:DNA-binding winged helix-turn-helix (wHTH) protein/TolB-like protein/Tfp pilus assembly protein PilF
MAGDSDPAAKQPPEELRVGPWRVEPAANEVRRDGQVVRLEPKAMELLAYLAARRGEVVGREALLAAIWPGVVVGDDALTQAIIKLRKALGDTAREPLFIETIAKRGYRLIAPVSSADAPAAADPAPRARRRVLPSAAAAVLVLACAGVAAAILAERWRSPPTIESLAGIAPDWSQIGAGPTLAVRPFEVLGDNPQQAMLARGLAADLVTDLGRVPGLTVLGGPEPQTAGESAALAARYVVSGTVQRDGERLRLNIGVTDAAEGRLLWSERFERPARDLFFIQDDLAARIVAALPVKLMEADRKRAAQRYTRSVEAFELFHQAEVAFWAWQREQNEIARELYRRAIAIDPAFGRAYGSLAMTYALEHRLLWTKDPDRTMAQALQLAGTALQLGPETPETLFAVAWVHMQAREYPEALRLGGKALRLNPSYSNAYTLTAFSLMGMGRPREALPYLQAALRLSPHPAGQLYVGLGKAYFYLREYAEARAHFESALARNPANTEAHLFMAATLAALGDPEGAAFHVAEVRLLQPDLGLADWIESYPHADRAERAQLRAELRKVVR